MQNNENLYDDPTNFRTSADTHPKQLTLCSAGCDDEDAKATLKLCPNFRLEDEAELNMAEGSNMTCANCWGLGFYSVCENNPKRMK